MLSKGLTSLWKVTKNIDSILFHAKNELTVRALTISYSFLLPKNGYQFHLSRKFHLRWQYGIILIKILPVQF